MSTAGASSLRTPTSTSSAEQERAAPAVLHEPLERRKRRPFMALLADVPAGAAAFELEVATATAPDPVAALAEEHEMDAHAAEALALEGREVVVPRTREVVSEATR